MSSLNRLSAIIKAKKIAEKNILTKSIARQIYENIKNEDGLVFPEVLLKDGANMLYLIGNFLAYKSDALTREALTLPWIIFLSKNEQSKKITRTEMLLEAILQEEDGKLNIETAREIYSKSDNYENNFGEWFLKSEAKELIHISQFVCGTIDALTCDYRPHV